MHFEFEYLLKCQLAEFAFKFRVFFAVYRAFKNFPDFRLGKLVWWLSKFPKFSVWPTSFGATSLVVVPLGRLRMNFVRFHFNIVARWYVMIAVIWGKVNLAGNRRWIDRLGLCSAIQPAFGVTVGAGSRSFRCWTRTVIRAWCRRCQPIWGIGDARPIRQLWILVWKLKSPLLKNE